MTSKTIALSGAEIRADYSGGTNAWLRNDGTATVYASAAPTVTAGADGVVSIPAGQAAAIYGACGSVYLLGTGSVQLVGSDYTACPFKVSAQSGGSGADEVARAAINAHAANAELHVTAEERAAWDAKADSADLDSHTSNTDIHVTAEEKTAWNAKADVKDIPTELPAKGGKADIVNCTQAIGSADICTYHSILDWANAYNGGSAWAFVIADYGFPTDAPVTHAGAVRMESDGNTGKIITFHDYVDSQKTYSRTMNNKSWLSSQWVSPDAGTLDGKHASEFVSKADYDALEARIAALEGGGT